MISRSLSMSVLALRRVRGMGVLLSARPLRGPVAVFDNHFHLPPSGLGVEGARQFEKAGGTALMLTHSPYHDLPIRRAEDHETPYDRPLELARHARGATRLHGFVAL